tara:strand:- start:80 stop:1234 length:1155 start_codon:yes stop_codon:yes gene_type:complete
LKKPLFSSSNWRIFLKIIADQNIYKLRSFLSENIELNKFNPNNGIPNLDEFDALFVRTVTALNSNSVPLIPSTLKLLGTASSGRDHIEASYFEQHGVDVIDANGCNAKAVSEYVMTSLLLWGIENSTSLQALKYGVIGVGAVGQEVQKQFDAFGLSYISYDPPRANRDSTFSSDSLEALLACDVLTFHIPLTKDDDHSTFHWLDESKLNSHSYKLIINTARGGVIDEQALLQALEQGRVQDVVIDVWENEPNFNSKLAQQAFISTPHIAGYSEQAKLKATQLLVDKFGEKFGLQMKHPIDLFEPKNLEIADLEYPFRELLLRLNPLKEYDVALRDLISRPDKELLFKKLRVDRPYRYEYPYLRISETFLDKFKELKLLGIQKIE